MQVHFQAEAEAGHVQVQCLCKERRVPPLKRRNPRRRKSHAWAKYGSSNRRNNNNPEKEPEARLNGGVSGWVKMIKAAAFVAVLRGKDSSPGL